MNAPFLYNETCSIRYMYRKPTQSTTNRAKVCGYVAYLLGRFSTDLNEIWHGHTDIIKLKKTSIRLVRCGSGGNPLDSDLVYMNKDYEVPWSNSLNRRECE